MPRQLKRMLKLSEGNYVNVDYVIAVVDGQRPMGKRLYETKEAAGHLMKSKPKKGAMLVLRATEWVFVSDLDAKDMAGVVDRMLEDLKDE